MIPEEIKKQIEEKFPKTFVSGGISFDDYHVSSKREAAEFGYSLANETIVKKDEEINRLKGLVKEQYSEMHRFDDTSPAVRADEWNKFKNSNNL